MIRLSLDATNVQREKIVFELVKPYIPGFSVEPMEVDQTNEDEQEPPAKSKKIAQAEEMETATTSVKSKAKKNKKPKK